MRVRENVKQSTGSCLSAVQFELTDDWTRLREREVLVTSMRQEKLESRSVWPLLRPANMHLHGHFPSSNCPASQTAGEGGGEITVITSLSGPKCRRRDGLCVCVRERFVWSVSVCVASSWFLISINSLCCFWWCLLSASGQYGTSGHSCYMWNQCSFPHPCCASGWRGFFLCGNTPVTKRDNISITKAVELKRVGSWQTAHTGQITSYHY